MYWWMRANVRGCVSDGAPIGVVSAGGGSLDDPASCLTQHRAEPRIVETGEPRRPDRYEQRVRLAAVRVVGRVHDLLGRDLAKEVEEVERTPDGGVEEHARDPTEPPGEARHVRDPRMRDDQLDAVVPPDEASRGARRSGEALARRG